MVSEFFEGEIRDLLTDFGSYAIDFVVDEQLSQVRIVELNPWGESTSPGLFDWEKDKAVLLELLGSNF